MNPSCPPHSIVFDAKSAAENGRLTGRCRFCDYERTVPVNPIPDPQFHPQGISIAPRDTGRAYK